MFKYRAIKFKIIFSPSPYSGFKAKVFLASMAFNFLLTGICCHSNTNNDWKCSNYGGGRRCIKAIKLPSDSKWDCYISSGYTACIERGGTEKKTKGWNCSKLSDSFICIKSSDAIPLEPSPDGWQCFVKEKNIVCDWRREGNDKWNCTEKKCTEKFPDFPGPDEWECIENLWAVICRGRFLRDLHPGWNCTGYKDRFLCMNLDPDYPPRHLNKNQVWKCRYDNSMKTGRICEIHEMSKTDECSSCPGVCFDGKCFPDYKVPTCYYDFDCPNGFKCNFGACLKK